MPLTVAHSPYDQNDVITNVARTIDESVIGKKKLFNAKAGAGSVPNTQVLVGPYSNSRTRFIRSKFGDFVNVSRMPAEPRLT